jgi:hypothetical protein
MRCKKYFRTQDALNSQMIKGELVSEKLESGFLRFVSMEFPPLPPEALREVALRVERELSE